ncbi:MAG: tetratricopeptide repeat protein [Novosphingobium sp.]|nr:tetratricopeptide repeat protein [Novosphingobium sp.]
MKKLVFLPALALLAACGEKPEALLAKAQAEFAAHDYQAARLDLVEALRQAPGNREMQLLQAKTLLALGDGDGAGALLEQLSANGAPQGELAELSAEAALLRRSPDSAVKMLDGVATPEAERLRALAALQHEDATAAEDHFKQAVALGGNARAYADYARFRLMQGDLAGAGDMLRQAERAAPEGIDTLLAGGRIAQVEGDLKRALDRYKRAASLYPASLAALVGQAEALADLGRLDELDGLLKQVEQRGGQSLELTYLKARSSLARKQWTKVREIVQPVEAQLPKLHPLRMVYAEALLELGQDQLAIAQVQPIVRAQPSNRKAAALLARAQLAAGDARGALATFKPFADSREARPEELALMARIARAAADPAAAGYAARAARPVPEALGSDLSEADAAMRAGDWARAVTAYNRILAVTDGRNVIVLNNMANAQLMLGNMDKALTFAERALKLAPGNPSVMDTAGWVLFKSGKDPARAKRLLRQAAEKAPRNQTIQKHAAAAEAAAG